MEVRGCSSSADCSPSPFDSQPLIEEVRHLPGPVRRDLIRIALLTSDSLRRHGHPDSACIDKFCVALEAAEAFSKKINDMVEAERLASRPKRPREEQEEEGVLKRRRAQLRPFSSNVAMYF